jgi:peptidoglycan/LPS O-acetylase OafA/YrhL
MLALFRSYNKNALQKFTPAIVFVLAALNFLFYFFNKQSQFTLPFMAIVGYTTFAVLFGLFVNEGVEGNNKLVNIIFNNKILKFFGRISYGLYVFHWPLHLLALPYLLKGLANYIHNENLLLIAGASLTTVGAIIISVISYYYFESFFLRLRKRQS